MKAVGREEGKEQQKAGRSLVQNYVADCLLVFFVNVTLGVPVAVGRAMYTMPPCRPSSPCPRARGTAKRNRKLLLQEARTDRGGKQELALGGEYTHAHSERAQFRAEVKGFQCFGK